MTLSDLMFLVKNTRLFVEGGGKPPVIIDVGDDDAFSTQDITDILDKMVIEIRHNDAGITVRVKEAA